MNDATAVLDRPQPPAGHQPELEISSASIAPGRSAIDHLLEIDPRACRLCGLTIDRHERFDTAEGPEFYCVDLSPDEMTLPELERRAELRRQEDIAAILADMDAVERPRHPPAGEPPAYRPAQSTIDAFRLVVARGDVRHLKAWLRDRPKDAPSLLALLESPTSC
jgi:hypothetical protein